MESNPTAEPKLEESIEASFVALAQEFESIEQETEASLEDKIHEQTK
jgi:hypothetical protein